MASIQNFFTSRDNNTDGNTYVGQLDRLWYNPGTNSIFVSDGTTPGGQPVDLAANANAVFNNITINSFTANAGNVNGDLVITGNISPAATNKVGGISPGPGIVISDTGLLTIDAAGLPVSFGDFFANVNQLSMVNANEPMYLVSNGTGNINLIGGINFFKPNGFPPVAQPFFTAKTDGQLRILVPAEDPLEGGVEIIGSAAGTYITPGQPGAMLHLTGNPGVPTRYYMDGNGEYASIVGRRYNGNVAVPTQVLADQDVLRINATAATDAGVGNVSLAQIRFSTLENQTTTAQGSLITFTVTPVGSPASARVDVANVTVANGVTATKFNTSGTVSATGNINGGNVVSSALVQGVTVSATGNVNGGNIISSALIRGVTVSATGNLVSGNANITLAVNSATVLATGNITGGNILFGTGIVSGTGNLVGGNAIITSAVNSATVSATGNVTGGNINTAALVSARNYNGGTRDIGTLGAAGTITIDFATDHMILANLTTTATVAFANITAGKTVSVLLHNTTGVNRAITLGVTGDNTSGGNPAPNVNDGRTGVFVYRTFGTATGNVYCEVN